jgi:chromosome segregation protein
VHERYTFLTTQINDVTNALASLTELLATLERTMEEQFQTRFSDIQATFAKTFSQLFGGGKARIILVQEETPPSEDNPGIQNSKFSPYGRSPEGGEIRNSPDNYGIIIEAQPPGKKVKNLAMLSGGEKALTAIALVAALIAVAPTPFVVLDEVDASLDEGNSSRLADVLAELSARAQFIIITHNRSTMHKAKMLYGITMGEDGVSQALSVSFKEAEALAPTSPSS